MKPRTIIILVFAWVITLPIAWTLGYMKGNTVRISAVEAHKKAQVDYLMKIAYPERVPSLEVLQKVRVLAERPEEVRAYLVEVQDKRIQEAIEETGASRTNEQLWRAHDRFKRESNDLTPLQEWKPGQTGPADK
jgi:hypothetical protein